MVATHACMQAYTNHTHAQMQAFTHKAKFTAGVTQLLLPSVPTMGCLDLLRHLSLVQVNSSGAGLVTQWRTVQVSQIEVVQPTVP